MELQTIKSILEVPEKDAIVPYTPTTMYDSATIHSEENPIASHSSFSGMRRSENKNTTPFITANSEEVTL